MDCPEGSLTRPSREAFPVSDWANNTPPDKNTQIDIRFKKPLLDYWMAKPIATIAARILLPL